MPRPTCGRTSKNLTDDERVTIFEMAEHAYPVSVIAEKLGRGEQAIYRYLATLKATGQIARRYAEAQALTLTKRVVKHADVAESLEVLDRLDVLPKKRDAGGGPSVVVCVGMPGSPALLPPSVSDIAQAVSVRTVTP